jgi:hypothetical protein
MTYTKRQFNLLPEKKIALRKEQQKRYAKNHSEQIKEYSDNHKEERKQYYIDNKEEKKEYYINNKENVRNRVLKRLYNITQEQYNELFNKQNGCCAICKKHQSILKEKLNVDHNHLTGKIRGLLCTKCNRSLGNFNDDANILDNASNYLKTNN